MHSFLRIYYEYLLEKILQFRSHVFEFLLFSNSGLQTEIRMTASSVYLGFHIMAFEGIFCKEHKIAKYTQSPNIYRYSVIRVANNLRGHIFLSATMCFCACAADGSGESKISNFVSNIVGVFVLVHFFK